LHHLSTLILFFSFNAPSTTDIYTLSLHDALPISFFISYSTYKDSLIMAHRQLVENLSVPIIPINSSVSILPLIGSVDSFRSAILDRKSTRLNSSHVKISYAVFCLKKKNK